MPRVVSIAGLMFVLGGCAQLLGVDDVSYRGGDAAADALAEATGDAALDVAPDVTPSCDGGCTPTTLVSMSGLAPTLATDGALVFFRTAGNVWSCPTTGCANATPVATTSATGLHVVGAASDLVVWSDGDFVFGCAPGACGAPATYADFSPKPVTGVAASPSSTFVLASGGDTSSLSVHRNALDGSAETTVFAGNPGGGAPGPVAAALKSQHVYWSQVGTPTLYDCAQATCASPADTLAVTASPGAIVATSSFVFVATSGGLLVTPPGLASSSPLVGGAIAGVALSPDSAARVYFATGASVASCAANAGPCSPTTHYTGSSAISALAADDVALYWIEGSNVMRLAL